MVSLMKILEGTLLGGIHPVDSYTDANVLLLLIVTMYVSPLLHLMLMSTDVTVGCWTTQGTWRYRL